MTSRGDTGPVRERVRGVSLAVAFGLAVCLGGLALIAALVWLMT